MSNKRFTIISMLAAGSILLSACGGDSTATPLPAATATTPAAAAPTNTAAMAADATNTPASGTADATATTSGGGDMPYKGTKVSIFGVAADEQARTLPERV